MSIKEKTKHNLDFPVGCRVIITATYCDTAFFPGTQTGSVIRNSGGYLGIRVLFDKPMNYEDGTVRSEHGFNWEHLQKIIDGATMPDKIPEDLIPVLAQWLVDENGVVHFDGDTKVLRICGYGHDDIVSQLIEGFEDFNKRGGK